MGGDATKEPPFFFTKAGRFGRAGRAAGGRAASRYPLATKNLHHEIELVVAIGGRGVEARARAGARARLRLRGRARHDAARPAERHAREEAAVGHRQVVRRSRADRADPSGQQRSGILRAARSGSTSTARAGRQGDLADMIWDVAAHARVPVAVLRAAAGRSRVHRHAVGRRAGRRRRSARRRHRRRSARSLSRSDRRSCERSARGARHRLHARISSSAATTTRAAVPDHPQWLAHYAEASRGRTRRFAPRLDLRYGPGPKETLDLFLPAGPRPRRRSSSCTAATGARSTRAISRSSPRRSSRRGSPSPSSTTTFAPTFRSRRSSTNAGARSPGSRARAQRTAPDAERIVVGGHSAGGHLVAMLLRDRLGGRGARPRPDRRRRVALRRPRSRRRWCCSRSTRTSSSTTPRQRGFPRRGCARARRRPCCSPSGRTRPPSSSGRRTSCGTRGRPIAPPATPRRSSSLGATTFRRRRLRRRRQRTRPPHARRLF